MARGLIRLESPTKANESELSQSEMTESSTTLLNKYTTTSIYPLDALPTFCTLPLTSFMLSGVGSVWNWCSPTVRVGLNRRQCGPGPVPCGRPRPPPRVWPWRPVLSCSNGGSLFHRRVVPAAGNEGTGSGRSRFRGRWERMDCIGHWLYWKDLAGLLISNALSRPCHHISANVNRCRAARLQRSCSSK